MTVTFRVCALLVALLAVVGYYLVVKPNPLAKQFSVLQEQGGDPVPIDDKQRVVLVQCMKDVSSPWFPDLRSYAPGVSFFSPKQFVNVRPGSIVVNEERSFGWVQISAYSDCYDRLAPISPLPVHPERRKRG